MTKTLVIDTCGLLDLLRAPLISTFHPHHATGVLRLATAVESSGAEVRVVLADVVESEYRRNIDKVVQQTRDQLLRLHGQYSRATAIISALCELTIEQSIDEVWIDKSMAALRLLADRIAARATIEPSTQDDRDRGSQRVFAATAPSRRGKDNLVDCVLTQIVVRLGGSTTLVFFSSNTEDFCDAGRLRSELRTEFAAAGIAFVRNWGEACATIFSSRR